MQRKFNPKYRSAQENEDPLSFFKCRLGIAFYVCLFALAPALLAFPAATPVTISAGQGGQPITDLGATISAEIAMLPTIGGYQTGTVSIPAGVYNQSSVILLNSPRVSIIGAGSGAVTINCVMNSPCWEIRLNPFVTDPQGGGQLGGFTLVGLGTNASAVGIHMGDFTGLRMEDIVIQGFTGANAVGMWWDNLNGWIERTTIQRLTLNSNTTNYKFTNAGNDHTSSFCYNQWLDFRMNVNGGQKGIDFQNGNLCGSTMMLSINGAGDNKTYINIQGPTSYWNNNLYDIRSENDGGTGVRLATGPNTNFTGTGLITNLFGAMTDDIEGAFELYFSYLGGTTYSANSATTQWAVDQFANLRAGTTVSATASNNVSSPLLGLEATCWNGGGTGVDKWQLQNLMSPGTNSASTLNFNFSPWSCSSPGQVNVSDGVGSGFMLTTSVVGPGPGIRHDADDNVFIESGTQQTSILYLNTDNNKPVKLGMTQTFGANIPIVASFTTALESSTTVNMFGVTPNSHCSLTPTNAAAASSGQQTYISQKNIGNIVVTHQAMSGMSYDIMCTPN
jgi:hypothetical protein